MKKNNSTKINGKEIARVPDATTGEWIALNSGDVDDLRIELFPGVPPMSDAKKFQQFAQEQFEKANRQP